MYSAPYRLFNGKKIGASCYWICTVKVPTKGMEYTGIRILQKVQEPLDATGGC